MPTLGGPGETQETTLETLREIPRLKPLYCAFGVGWRIQPRTPLRERAVAEGLLSAQDDCYEPRFYVSPATPRPWLEEQIKRHQPSKLTTAPRVASLLTQALRGPLEVGARGTGTVERPELTPAYADSSLAPG